MERERPRLRVRCVTCGADYEQGAAPAPGCPACGSQSWIAAWLAAREPSPQAREM